MPYYAVKGEPEEGFYDIEETDEGFRWTWGEVAKGEAFHDVGKWRATRAEALEDAAADWDDNGTRYTNPRLAGMLRALAERARGSSSNG